MTASRGTRRDRRVLSRPARWSQTAPPCICRGPQSAFRCQPTFHRHTGRSSSFPFPLLGSCIRLGQCEFNLTERFLVGTRGEAVVAHIHLERLRHPPSTACTLAYGGYATVYRCLPPCSGPLISASISAGSRMVVLSTGGSTPAGKRVMMSPISLHMWFI